MSLEAVNVEVVVVGVEGSPASLHALTWPIRAFGPHITVHAVHAVSPAIELAVAVAQVDSRKLVEERRRELEREWLPSVGDLPVKLETHVVEDEPAPALLEVAGAVSADLILVGAHGRWQHGPRRVGRTIAGLVEAAGTALSIVPEGSDLASGGAVVVGVTTGGDAEADASAPSLRWAVSFAKAHDLGLCLVRAGGDPPLFSAEGFISKIGQFLEPGVLKSWALEDLSELADRIRHSTDAELRVSVSAPGRRAGPRLVEASANASALVLDARRDRGRPVPPWMHHAIGHARCPVVLVPPDERG
jgi:nucleotide-binding universal stress UspA family protein